MTTKNAKDMILVSCQEVPETICVETRFVPSSAAVEQRQKEQVYYITNNGNFELIRPDEQLPPINIPTLPTTFPLNYNGETTPSTLPTVQHYKLPHQPQTAGARGPSGPKTYLNNDINNSNNAHINLSVGQSLNSLARSFSNASQFQKFNLSTSIYQKGLSVNDVTKVPTIRRSDKFAQTDVSALNNKSIATQCNLDYELDDLDFECSPIHQQECFENQENIEIEKENFLKFVKTNSAQHKNCKECLICGELCKSNKYFYGHMAIHQGPKDLCYRCGQQLDHKNLLLQHKCLRTRQLAKSFLQCPHHTCSVKAISMLELYDHINEHANNRIYRCSVCRKSFCTRQEFLRHLLIRAKCYTGAKRNRFRFYGLDSQRDRSCRMRVFTLHTFKKCTVLVKTFLSQRVPKRGICKICLRSFSNKSVYSCHRAKCITKFRKRLIRKRRN